MESIIEKNSVYKDEFLLRKYITIMIEHRARRHFEGKSFVRNIVFDYLNEQMDDLKDKFLFINYADSIDIVKTSLDYLEKYALYNGKFMFIHDRELDYMTKREIFLVAKLSKNQNHDEQDILKNATQDEVDSELNASSLSDLIYKRSLNALCPNCSEKDVCLESFRIKKA